jgi:xylan 1,4-beta-xylosidase
MTNLQGSLRIYKPRGRILLFLIGVLALLLALFASAFNGMSHGIVHAASPSISSGISYRIVNRNSSIVLDVPGSSTADGATIDQSNDDGTTNQLWQFVAVGSYYRIVNQNSSKVLEVNGTTIDQRTNNGGTNQQWQLVTAGSYYQIVNRSSGKALEVAGSSQATGAKVGQSSSTSATNQQWILFQTGTPIFPPAIKPLFNIPNGIRDTYVMLGPDGVYYMTGTQGNAWQNGTGIELWSSTDLKTWTAHGYIWTFTQATQDGCWCAQSFLYSGSHGTYQLRVIWAPELHYINGTYYIPFSMPGGGTGILKSSSGKVTGPYHIENAAAPIAHGHIDPSLFQDTDGTVYYLDKRDVAKMKSDMSGLAEPLVKTGVIDEGVEMIKHNGIYMLAAAHFPGLGYYNSEVQNATSIYGPYTGAYEAVPWAGHGNYFIDAKGQLWCTMFGDNTSAPVYNQPALVPAKFSPDNRIRVDLNPRA